MLTSTGYLLGLLIYSAAALVALVLANLWLLPRASAALRVLLTLPVAALLLTPAYFEPGADTFAPALVVAAFSWLSEGPEAASHAVRPLVLFTSVGLAMGAIIGTFLWFRGRRSERLDPALDLSADP